MIYKRIFLEDGCPEVYLDCYVADKISDLTRKAILVVPGGAYGMVCSEREGEPIAMAFMPYGYNAFVLHYSVARKKVFPGQLIEASMAMKHIRDHAEEYGIDPEKIFVTGFSAGGHLAGSLGVMWNKKEIYEAMEMPYGYNRPAGMMLVYPVITGIKKYSHFGSFQNLLGEDEPSAERLEEASLEANVTSESVPLYIVHTSNDQVVDVRNSLTLAESYREAGLTFEMHIFPDGPHGVGLGNHVTRCGVAKWENAAVAKWVENAVFWADQICGQ